MKSYLVQVCNRMEASTMFDADDCFIVEAPDNASVEDVKTFAMQARDEDNEPLYQWEDAGCIWILPLDEIYRLTMK